jgi:hypothetical protein
MARKSLFSGTVQLGGFSFLGVEKVIEDRLKQVIEALTKELYARAQQSAQSELKVHSGKLLRSLREKAFYKPGIRVGGLVKTPYYIARFQELGFTRRTKDGKKTYKHPFLRPALDSMEGDVRTAVQRVIDSLKG